MRLNYSRSFTTFCTVLSIVIVVSLLTSLPVNLLSRQMQPLGRSVAETLLFSNILRNVIVYGFTISFASYIYSKKGLLNVIIQSICLLIANFLVAWLDIM